MDRRAYAMHTELGSLAKVHREALEQSRAKPELVPPPQALETMKLCDSVQTVCKFKMRSKRRVINIVADNEMGQGKMDKPR